jgi:hypothetical protein
MTSQKFNVDDLVVAFGSTSASEGSDELHHVLCKVIAVGKSDIILRPESVPGIANFRSKNRSFKISTDRCVLVIDKCKNINSQVRKPVLGDLVLSIDEKYTSTEKKIGVLVEIIDVPGASVLANILESEEFTTVSFDTLIVLESSK